MNDFEKAISDPERFYEGEPEKVIKDDSLSKDQKIKILRQWEYDIRDILVAEEEAMPSGNEFDKGHRLTRIMKLLRELGVETDVDRSPPTKQGGE